MQGQSAEISPGHGKLPPAGRCLLNLLAAAGAVIGLVTLAAWVLSDIRSDELFHVDGRRVWSAVSVDGELGLGWHRCDGGAQARQGFTARHGVARPWTFGTTPWQRLMPFWLSYSRAANGSRISVPVDDARGYVTVPASSVMVVVQYRILLPVMSTAIALWAWRWMLARRVNRWRQSNRCPACGYDLRATPETCPECGACSTQAVF